MQETLERVVIPERIVNSNESRNLSKKVAHALGVDHEGEIPPPRLT